jgi:hypothetical protein
MPDNLDFVTETCNNVSSVDVEKETESIYFSPVSDSTNCILDDLKTKYKISKSKLVDMAVFNFNQQITQLLKDMYAESE